MAITHPYSEDDLLRYLDDDLAEGEKRTIEQHLATCKSCQEYVSFVRDFKGSVAELTEEEFSSQEPCPDTWTLVSYEAGDVDEETARHLRVHLLFCDACAEEFYALRRSRPKVIDVILRIAQGLLVPRRLPIDSQWELLPANSTLRKGRQILAAPFQVRETVADPDTGEACVLIFRLEEAVEPERMRVMIGTDAVPDEQGKWEICLLDSEQEEIASMPLDEDQTEVHSGLPYGFYTVEIRKLEECLIGFAFTVEPFSLLESVDAANEYLEIGEYSRAITILDDAAERYRDSREVLELRAVVRSLAWRDVEAFEQDQKKIGRVLAAKDFSEEIVGTLNEVKEKIGESVVYVVARSQLDPSAVPVDVENKAREEKPSVLILPTLQLMLERLERIEKRIESSDQRTMQLLNNIVHRLDEFPLLVEDLTQKVDAIRAQADEDSDRKFWAIGEVLQNFPAAVASRGLSLPDLAPYFRVKLEEPCWSWLGGEVQKMFVTAEDLYWYLGKKPAHQSPDFSPPLLEFCRGLEVLLNDKLGRACIDVRNLVQGNITLVDLMRAKLPRLLIDKLTRKPDGPSRSEKSFTLRDIAILMRVGQMIVRQRPGSLKQHTTLFNGLSVVTSLDFFAVLSHVGVNIRNGKSHRALTSVEEMHLTRKLVMGFDEERLRGTEVLQTVRNAPWLTSEEAEMVFSKLSGVWAKYPGLVRILWTSLEVSSQAQPQ